MRGWAIRLVTYPVLLVLALIFIGPTIPIDMSILIITALVAMLGLSKEPHVGLGIRSYLAQWRRAIYARLKP
jgi:hypothetical protein